MDSDRSTAPSIPTLDSLVAVKTLSVDNDAAILMRFRNEAAASRRLRHPNIVTIYDFGEQDGITLYCHGVAGRHGLEARH